MKIQRFATPADFEAVVKPFLLEREAEHNLILGICANLQQRTRPFEQPPYFACIYNEAEQVVAAVMMTPPRNLLLSHLVDPAAIGRLVEDLQGFEAPVTGVQGKPADSRAFADAWSAATGQGYRVGMPQRIYQLTQVKPPTGIAGQMRKATVDDRDLLIGWIDAFSTEALATASNPDQAAETVDAYLQRATSDFYKMRRKGKAPGFIHVDIRRWRESAK